MYYNQFSTVKIFRRGAQFVHKEPYCSKINISCNCKEKNLKISNFELDIKSSTLNILSLFIASTGDLDLFKKNLNDVLKHQCNPKAELLICGDRRRSQTQIVSTEMYTSVQSSTAVIT
jgi:hypothetical protein